MSEQSVGGVENTPGSLIDQKVEYIQSLILGYRSSNPVFDEQFDEAVANATTRNKLSDSAVATDSYLAEKILNVTDLLFEGQPIKYGAIVEEYMRRKALKQTPNDENENQSL